MRSIFRFSNYCTNYFFNNKIIDLPKNKFQKINETIYSSIHGLLVSSMASLSISQSLFEYNNIKENDNKLQYLTASLCFSYFIIDIFKCLLEYKYLFILHHIAALGLLSFTFLSFYKKENNGFYAMNLIFLLESNTFLLNLGFLLKEFKFHYSITCTVWIIHLIFFVLFRIIAIPRILIIYYMNESWNIINLSQIPFFILILSGSVYWAYRQTIGISKYLKENSVI
jgi:hypothetical protein